MGKKKKTGEATSKDDDVDDVQHELDIKHALEQQPLERDHLLLNMHTGAISVRQWDRYYKLCKEPEERYFLRLMAEEATAAQTVAIATPEKATAIATTVAIAAPEKAAAIATPAAAQAVAIAAPERVAAIATPVAIAALEQAAAIATHSGSEDKQTVTDIAAETATAIASPEEEIERLQLLLTSQQAATTAAIAAAKEAAAAATTLEVEVKRLLLLLAATTAKVFVPGYTVPMTPEEHLHALHRQVQYLLEQQQYMNEQHCAAASHAQYWADRCFTAETANAAGTATTAIIPVPATANEPSREDTRSQPRANAKSTSSPTYAQAVMSSDPSLSPVVKRSTGRTTANGRDCPANAAREE